MCLEDRGLVRDRLWVGEKRSQRPGGFWPEQLEALRGWQECKCMCLRVSVFGNTVAMPT